MNRLPDNDGVRRLQFPIWAAGEHEILFNIRFLDKVCFHLDGTVSKWNMRFWGMEPTGNFRGKSSHRGKVTTLVAMSSHSLIGPVFFNETVNSGVFGYTAERLLATTTANSACLSIHSVLCKMVSLHTANFILD